MEKIKISGIKREVYHEKLNNGLDVYMLNFKSKNYYISMTSRFGSSITFVKDLKTNKKVQIKTGTAHFLEHQLFEEEKINAFTRLANLGANANAYTSYDNTSYLVLGDKNFKEVLEYTLDFIQNPYFIEKNIEIERKIIEEEIDLNKDDYFSLALSALNNNLYKKDPRKDLITGSVLDIQSIKAHDLERAYKYFYNPENMFLVITGNFYPLEAIGIIRENQKKKKFSSSKKISITKLKEPVNINKKNEIIYKDVSTPIISVGYKISKSVFKEIKEKDLNYLIDAFMFLTFGKSSDLNDLLISENLISENLDFSYEFVSNLIVLTITIRSKYVSEVINQIDKALVSERYCDLDLERYKRVKIAEYISNFDDVILVNDLIVNDLVGGKINTNYLEKIKSLSVKNLNKLANFMKNDSKSVVVIQKKV